jgi:hypothetical protein
MRTSSKLATVSVLLFALGATTMTNESLAAPVNVIGKSAIETPPLAQQAHYRHYYPRHYGYYHNYRPYRNYRHYGRYGYSRYGNPVGSAAGAAAGLATMPLQVLFGSPDYY